MKNSITKTSIPAKMKTVLARKKNCQTRIMPDGQIHIYKFKGKRITLNIYLSQHAITVWALINGHRGQEQIQKELKSRLAPEETSAIIRKFYQLKLLSP